ncbi:MAG TPA: ABC transporter permease [Actinomycetota bacterium]|nr:ABC transporter permease [Actinomycetota bacterium]
MPRRPIAPPAVRSRVILPGSRLAWFVAPFLVLVLLWWGVVAATDVPARIMPSPQAVWAAAVEQFRTGQLQGHIMASLRRVLIGVALAVVTGIPFGIALGTNRRVSSFFSPLLRFSVALAGIAWIPLATLWLGFGEQAVIFIIWNAVFFALAYNTMLGVSRIPSQLLRAARSLGATRARLFFEVFLPGGLPSIVTGMRVGMGYGWRGLIAAEIIASSAGLGYALFLAQKFYRTDIIVLSMIIIGLLWLLMDRLVLAPLERKTVERWGMKQAVR